MNYVFILTKLVMNEQMNIVNSPLSEELINDKTSFTRAWQQNQYLVDSGINSALETHTHSVSSRHGYDEMDSEDQINKKDWKCLSNININDNFTNDICMLTPESPGSNICGRQGGEAMADVNLSSAYDTGKTDCDLEFGLDIDKLEAESAIPDLVKLIKDEDDAVVINEATMMVFQLSKSDAIDALINSKEMISCIIEAMNKAEHADAVRFLAGAIYNMSQKKYGLKVIFEANVIPCLVKLLGFSMESVLFYAITTLHNLLLYQEDGKEAVRLSGCIPKLVSLLQKNNIKFLTICTDCLQILAFNHQPSKIEILKNGGPLHLIHIIKNYDYEKLLWTATRVLKVLSVCSANKPVIIREGGIEALTNILYHTIQRNTLIASQTEPAAENTESHPQFSQRLLHNCLWTLRNLSDAATRINFDHLLKVLVQILISSYNSFQRQNVHIDTNAVICAAGILSNLTCNNQYNKIALFKLGGVEALVRVIEWNFTSLTNNNPQNKLNSSANTFSEDILEPCICALRHLTSRHEEAETVQTSLIQLQGLSLLIRLLEMQLGPDLFHMQTHQPVMPNLFLSYYKINWTLIKAIIGLIRNMAMSSCNFVAIRERGFVWPMIVLINRAQIDIANKSACSPMSSKDKLLDEIMEVVCGALHMLAKDPGIRAQIISIKLWQRLIHCPQQIGIQSAINVIASLLFNGLESIQRVAVGLLVELSAERMALEMIMAQMVITNKLNEMVHSKSEAVSTYASAILIRATEEKNKRYAPCHGYNVQLANPPIGSSRANMVMANNPPNSSPGFLNSILNSPVIHSQPPSVSHRHMQSQCGDQSYANSGGEQMMGGDLDMPDMQVGYGPPQPRYSNQQQHASGTFLDVAMVPGGNQSSSAVNSDTPMRYYKHQQQQPPMIGGGGGGGGECSSMIKGGRSHQINMCAQIIDNSGGGGGGGSAKFKESMELCMADSDWIDAASVTVGDYPQQQQRGHKP
uniref:BCatenin1 n=1 Tax=Polycelis felina TaxID=39785 RepID=A0AA51NID9_9PLAT|nr:putative bCatenin1 [Polycelis felina]